MLATAVLLSASVWFYVDHIIVPFQVTEAAAHGRPRGNLSDLYPRWLGARELLLQGRDPYSPEITREIQAGYYGRPLDHSRSNDPEDQQAFAYPVYVIFLLAPFIHFPFAAVQKGFAIVLWLATALSILLWLRALRWKPPLSTTLAAMILTLGSIPFMQGLKLQQLSLLVAVLLAGAVAAVASRRLILAGVLLAIATIKPQLDLLPVLWLGGWALANWKSRKNLLISFFATLVLLLVGSQIILPGWIGEFLLALRDYHLYTHNTSVLGWLLTPVAGGLVSILLIVVTGLWVRRHLKEDSDTHSFTLMVGVVMALTILTIPMTAPYNYLLLVPPLLLLVRYGGELWRCSKIVSIATLGVVLWPWLAALGLALASLFMAPTEIQKAWKLPLYTSQEIPIMVFVAMAYFALQQRRTPPLPQ